jgi:hypothetical protein
MLSIDVHDFSTPRALLGQLLHEHPIAGFDSANLDPVAYGVGLYFKGRYLLPDQSVAAARVPDGSHISIVGLPLIQPTSLVGAPIDQLSFTVTSPRSAAPDASFILDVWAHLPEQQRSVVEKSQAESLDGSVRVRSKGPARTERGTILTIFLEIDGLTVPVPEETMLWTGWIGNASFVVDVPADCRLGSHCGWAAVCAHGLQVLRINFEIAIGASIPPIDPQVGKIIAFRKAFASYASEDRNEVLGRVQGIQKVLPKLNIFMDVVSLRSGQYWEDELKSEIPKNDVFYLFWSTHARASKWVDKEWRWAFSARGLDFIDPIPLEPPDLAPPPRELSSRHFNDWTLAHYHRNPQKTALNTVGSADADTILTMPCELCGGYCRGLPARVKHFETPGMGIY